jgi:glycine dehydrogenase subunit 2
MAGFQVVTIPSDSRGNCDLEALRAAVGPDTAGLMITNPNTLGLWDEHLEEIVAAVHEAGGLVYNDGANFNAILGIVRPGDLGLDIMHFNLHKTFSTPHGGGGPGSGPVGVRADLARFLPGERVRRVEPADDNGTDSARFELFPPPDSIGRLHAFHGNFGMFVRAYTYIRMHGAAGLRQVSEDAVLNANYIRASLRDDYDLPFGDRTCMHETVFAATRQKARGVRALDVAKRILDFGIHPPTVYFPLVVPEALMIEPTETESKESLDHFIAVMRQIAREAAETPEVVQNAPHATEYKRLDEVAANRALNLRWRPEQAEVKEPEAVAAAD